jgi:hypothetical protein
LFLTVPEAEVLDLQDGLLVEHLTVDLGSHPFPSRNGGEAIGFGGRWLDSRSEVFGRHGNLR